MPTKKSAPAKRPKTVRARPAPSREAGAPSFPVVGIGASAGGLEALEIMSSNEELQSTNEELDTAKEELQSTNEELNTVNDELNTRNAELSLVNSDLMNLLHAVPAAILIVSSSLRIRRFTPRAEQVLNVIPTDVGRPLGDLKPNIDVDDLESLAREVIETVIPKELAVHDRTGRSYSLRIRPYKDTHNRIDGAVLALIDLEEWTHAAPRDELMRRLVAAQEAERRRIARELHDQMGQHVVALSLGLAQLAEQTKQVAGAADSIARLQQVADVLARDTHHLALQLRPSALDHLGLAVAVTSFAEDVATRSEIDVDVHVGGLANRRFDAVVETAVYRIVQEAVTNAVRHADARGISVIVELRNAELHAIIEDDGRGFDVDRAPTGNNARESLGLAGMHERASLIGGVLHIESRRGQGTTIYLTAPASVTDKKVEHEQAPVAPRR